MRYRILESIREYAQNELVRSGEFEVTAAPYAKFFGEFSERAYSARPTTPRRLLLNTMAVKENDAKAALIRLLDVRDQLTAGLSIVVGFSIWFEAGRTREALQWVDAFIPPTVKTGEHDMNIVKLLIARSIVQIGSGAVSDTLEAIDLARPIRDRSAQARAHLHLSVACRRFPCIVRMLAEASTRSTCLKGERGAHPVLCLGTWLPGVRTNLGLGVTAKLGFSLNTIRVNEREAS